MRLTTCASIRSSAARRLILLARARWLHVRHRRSPVALVRAPVSEPERAVSLVSLSATPDTIASVLSTEPGLMGGAATTCRYRTGSTCVCLVRIRCRRGLTSATAITQVVDLDSSLFRGRAGAFATAVRSSRFGARSPRACTPIVGHVRQGVILPSVLSCRNQG